MKWLIPRKDRLRHNILGVIFDKIHGNSVNTVIDAKKVSPTIPEMAKMLRVTERDVYLACYGMDDSDIEFIDYGSGNAIVFGETLINSYNTEKYLTKGRKQRVEVIKDNLYIIVSSIAIISAISSLIVYLTSIRNTQKEVTQLRTEVREIQNRLNQPNPQKKIAPASKQ